MLYSLYRKFISRIQGLVRFYSRCPWSRRTPGGGRVLRKSRRETWDFGLTNSDQPFFNTIYPEDLEISDLEAGKDYVLILRYKKDSWVGAAIWTTAWSWSEAEGQWEKIDDDRFNPGAVLFSDEMKELLGRPALCMRPEPIQE